MLKEKGYDEFVDQCVQKAREEYQTSVGFSLAEAKAHSKKVIEQKSQELKDFNRDIVYG